MTAWASRSNRTMRVPSLSRSPTRHAVGGLVTLAFLVAAIVGIVLLARLAF